MFDVTDESDDVIPIQHVLLQEPDVVEVEVVVVVEEVVDMELEVELVVDEVVVDVDEVVFEVVEEVDEVVDNVGCRASVITPKSHPCEVPNERVADTNGLVVIRYWAYTS